MDEAAGIVNPNYLAGPLPIQTRALRACTACKKRKGRCDKTLPACAFCHSKRRPCYYAHYLPTTEDDEASCFPAALYLDHDVFEMSPLELPLPGFGAPQYVTAEVGDVAEKRQIASQFFSSIHLWMPIISKQKFFNSHLNPPAVYQADIALLCLSMKLIMWLPSSRYPDSCPPLYFAARQFLYSVELSKCLTLPIIQAAVLITIFEIGHAIYPAARTSMGLCIEYAAAMGLGWKTARWGQSDLSWVETEERMRVWWAIVLLERYTSLGWSRRPIITEGPSYDQLLPSDDSAWDEGIQAPNSTMTASAPFNINMGPFARLAQATYLLDQVLNYIQGSERSQEEDIRLDQALRALVATTENETTRRRTKLYCHTALCYSAMVLLHKAHLFYSPEVFDALSNRQSLARDAMDKASLAFFDESEKILSGDGPSFDTTFPFILYWGYETLIHLTSLTITEPQRRAQSALETIHSAFRKINSRWKAADAYLSMLGSIKHLTSSPPSQE